MKVLHLVSVPQLTGAAEPVVDLVRALRPLGVDVDLRIDTRRTGNLRGLLESAGEVVSDELALSTKAGPFATLRDLARLRRRLPEYDVVHTHLSNDHTLAVLARGFARRPLVIRTIHASRAMGRAPWRRWILRQSDGLTVACEAHREQLMGDLSISSDRVLVLPGSVDVERFRPDGEARARVRGVLGLDDGAFVIGSVARFQAGRRHDVLLDAVARARQSEPSIRLVLIGHGETEPELRARASAPDLLGAVIFAGYHTGDLNDYLVALDVAAWLVPGNDATSRAVLQAMAAGLPVLGGAVGAIAESVVPEQTGLLVDPDDSEALAHALLGLAKDRERCRRFGARARTIAVERYSRDQRGRRALEFYTLLLRDRALPASTVVRP